MDFKQIYTLVVVVLLVYALYKEFVSPAIIFFLSAVALVLNRV